VEQLWIVASLAAAAFQALRYAALKELNQHLSASVATYVRMLFGLPFLAAYLAVVMGATGEGLPATPVLFWVYCGVSAIMQFLMTLLVVRLFQIGNFAVGLMLTRADVILTAVVGSVLFSEVISGGGWLAILVTVAGVLTTSAGRLPPGAWRSRRESLGQVALGPATRLGFASATFAAFSYLALREAILVLDPSVSPLVRSGLAAVAMTGVSFVMVGAYLLLTERRELMRVRHWLALATFVGFTSAAGTIGWFTASALANASYVAAVAQVQVVFALAISRYWFRERIRPLEVAGIVLILGGVLLFRAV
jgi:drug/metabolite transporter (DMT)-like permease